MMLLSGRVHKSMLVCGSAQASASSRQICSSIANRRMTQLRAACGTSQSLVVLCRDTLHYSLFRKVAFMLSFGWTVLIQDGKSLAAGHQPALPGTTTSPKKPQLPPAQAGWDVLLLVTHVGIIENGISFTLIPPILHLLSRTALWKSYHSFWSLSMRQSD